MGEKQTVGSGSDSARTIPSLDPQPQPAILYETAELWRFASKHGFSTQLKKLHQPRPVRFLLAALFDWALVVGATLAVVVYGWSAVFFSMIVAGNRQRALGNLLHDASHWSMDGDRSRAALVGNLLFCWPLAVSMRSYRLEHNQHHRYLGDGEKDPDFIQDETRLAKGSLLVWLDQLRSARMFEASMIGNFRTMDRGARLGVVSWWIAVFVVLTFAVSTKLALTFVLLWFASKASVFHAITSFREISDHVGLERGSLVGFSRNHPFTGPLGWLFHPHNNGYHLLHHLTPGIPFHALPRAHALVARWPRYAEAEQCASYFTGERSAIQSWVARFKPTPAR